MYSNQIRTRLLNTLLKLVCGERVGEVINRGLFRNITMMLMDLGPSVYEQEFETHFLQVSTEFYRAESQKFIECCACGDYLKNAEKRLTEEMDRVNHYLDPGTGNKITNVVKKEMIENYMLILIHKENYGLVSMLCYDKYDDLGRMYNLFRRVTDGLSYLYILPKSSYL
uniref:Cullin-3 n=1 Tax=Cajanus cajan TaxID=3821 RepID=A0A151TFR6_CAJCA|nr:Cullin-3 [Cajanus cajan]